MANKQLTGNKGEWSEVYVLFRLLADGFVKSSVKEINHNGSEKCTINSVIRNHDNDKLCYSLKDKGKVFLFINNKFISEYKVSEFSKEAKILFEQIINIKSKSGAFAIPCMDGFLDQIRIDRLKASSKDKSDITLDYNDVYAAGRVISGFSIKSYLGSAPTLLNPSGQTKFRYRFSITDANALDKLKLLKEPKDIVCALDKYFKENSIKNLKIESLSKNFKNNLCFISDNFEYILGFALYLFYAGYGISIKDIVSIIKKENPINYPKEMLDIYEYRFKRLLSSIALGMQPGRLWNGYDEANGGYIVVTKSGDVVVYNLYHRNAFEDMLYVETKFDAPSKTRYNYGSIQIDDQGYYFDLCLQIRFK